MPAAAPARYSPSSSSAALSSEHQQRRHTLAAAAATAAVRRRGLTTLAARAAGMGPADGAASPLEARKRRVREEVKGALRLLSQAQMAEESEWLARRGGRQSVGAVGSGARLPCCQARLLPTAAPHAFPT